MRIGIIGEQFNTISYLMLLNSIECQDIEIKWFIDAKIHNEQFEKLYGKAFNFGPIVNFFIRLDLLIRKKIFNRTNLDCKKKCKDFNIRYITPQNLSINNGLPLNMYNNPSVDYVLIAGCDQVIDKNGLKLAKNSLINYHYSPLPSYRGKFSLFWQWFNREDFIGYSFHKVNLGIDSGEIIYQGKINYSDKAPFHSLSKKVVYKSAKDLTHLYRYLSQGETCRLKDQLKESYYPAKKYHQLLTINRKRKIIDIMDIFKRTNFLFLENRLIIKKITRIEKQIISNYEVSFSGIKIPLSDGYIIGTPFSKIPFFLLYIFIGKKRILKGLS